MKGDCEMSALQYPVHWNKQSSKDTIRDKWWGVDTVTPYSSTSVQSEDPLWIGIPIPFLFNLLIIIHKIEKNLKK